MVITVAYNIDVLLGCCQIKLIYMPTKLLMATSLKGDRATLRAESWLAVQQSHFGK